MDGRSEWVGTEREGPRVLAAESCGQQQQRSVYSAQPGLATVFSGRVIETGEFYWETGTGIFELSSTETTTTADSPDSVGIETWSPGLLPMSAWAMAVW